MTGRRFVPADTVTRALVSLGVALLVVGLVVSAAVPAASLGTTGTGADGEGDQVDPASIEDERDLSAFERQLADRLAERARSDATNLSNGDYEQVRESLNGSEYESLLEEYESVAGSSDDRDRTVAYRRMLSAQAAFVDALDRFETAHDSYQRLRGRLGEGAEVSAVNGGSRTVVAVPGRTSDPDTAVGPATVRSAAHRVEDRYRRVSETGSTLIERYRRLATVSNESYADARRSVYTQMLDVYSQRQAATRGTLVESELTVINRTTTPSVTDALVVSGRLTANGSGVADGRVELAVGGRNTTTRTGSDGYFAVSLYPRQVSTDVTTATLRYVPDGATPTAATEESIPVELRTVDATATVSATPSSVGFGDEVRISGRAVAGGSEGEPLPLDNTSVVVRSGGSVLTRNVTDTNGTYDVAVPLPRDVPAGDQRLTAVVRPGDRLVAGAEASTPVSVVERTPDLSVDARQGNGATVDVTGNLTAAGVPVDGGQVAVLVGGERVGTTTTGPDGAFETTVAVPDTLLERGFRTRTTTVQVAVVYSEPDGNLADETEARSTTVTTGNTPLLAGVAVAAAVLVGGGTVLVRRGWRPWASTDGTSESEGATDDSAVGDGPSADPGDETDGSPDATADVSDPSALVSAASGLLDADPGGAVRVAYAALRRRLEDEVGETDRRRTHWEFYRDCREAGLDGEALSALREATEQYERVTYATGGVSADAARATFERVAAFVEDRSANEPAGAAGD